MSCLTIRIIAIMLVIYTIGCTIFLFNYKVSTENFTNGDIFDDDEILKISIDSNVLYSLNINPLKNDDNLSIIQFAGHTISFKYLDRVINTEIDNLMIFLYKQSCVVIIDNYTHTGLINDTLAKISNQFTSNIFIFLNQEIIPTFNVEKYRSVYIYGNVDYDGCIIPKNGAILTLPEPTIIDNNFQSPSAPPLDGDVQYINTNIDTEKIKIISNHNKKESLTSTIKNLFK